ncbi:MAG: hypothetical protein AB7V06_18885 [Candidatus Obscuribacterales bacterium]
MNINLEFKDRLKASAPATPVHKLYSLAGSDLAAIRARVAENLSSPGPLLELLSIDTSSEVRAGVALNRRAPLRTRWRLAMDDSPDVRYQMAESAFMPMDILIWLSTDDNPYVAHRADRTLEQLMNNGIAFDVKGGSQMSAVKIEQTLRRMLNNKPRLSKRDAVMLKELILADNYISRSEAKVILNAIRQGKLDQQAEPIFQDLLAKSRTQSESMKSIA